MTCRPKGNQPKQVFVYVPFSCLTLVSVRKIYDKSSGSNLESVSVNPVYGNPRTGLLRTYWETDRVLRSPLRGLCVQGALCCLTRRARCCAPCTRNTGFLKARSGVWEIAEQDSVQNTRRQIRKIRGTFTLQLSDP